MTSDELGVLRIWRVLCSCSARIAAEGAAAKPRTVKSELSRLATSGQITTTERTQRLCGLQRHQAGGQAAPPRHDAPARAERRGELVEGIAARRKLNGPRLVPLWLMLDTNRVYWTTAHLRAVHAPDLVLGLPARLAVLPGPGPAVPPARELRASSTRCGRLQGNDEAAGQLLDELLAAARPARRRRRLGVLLRVRRRPAAVGVRPRPGHRACRRWRACAKRLGRQDEVLPIAQAGARASSRPNTPEGVRVPTSDGAEYALYSVRARPARHQRLRAGAGRALRPRQDRRRPGRPGALHPGRAWSRGASCRRSTPAPGRSTRAARSSTSPTSPTTSSLRDFLHNLCTRTARARLLRHRAAASPQYLSSRRRSISLATRDAARRHARQGAVPALEDLARRR